MRIPRYTSLVCLLAVVFGMGESYGVNMTAQIQRLMNEKQEKISKLEECDGKRKGFMIAGISTLGLTAVGVGGNIALASKSNKLSDQIEEKNLELEKQQSRLIDINAQISQKQKDNARAECEKLKDKEWKNGQCVDKILIEKQAPIGPDLDNPRGKIGGACNDGKGIWTEGGTEKCVDAGSNGLTNCFCKDRVVENDKQTGVVNGQNINKIDWSILENPTKSFGISKEDFCATAKKHKGYMAQEVTPMHGGNFDNQLKYAAGLGYWCKTLGGTWTVQDWTDGKYWKCGDLEKLKCDAGAQQTLVIQSAAGNGSSGIAVVDDKGFMDNLAKQAYNKCINSGGIGIDANGDCKCPDSMNQTDDKEECECIDSDESFDPRDRFCKPDKSKKKNENKSQSQQNGGIEIVNRDLNSINSLLGNEGRKVDLIKLPEQKQKTQILKETEKPVVTSQSDFQNLINEDLNRKYGAL